MSVVVCPALPCKDEHITHNLTQSQTRDLSRHHARAAPSPPPHHHIPVAAALVRRAAPLIAVALILGFYHRLTILSPGEIVAKTKHCCKLHCYVRYQAYCYVPPQTLMKVSCESLRGIRAEIQMLRLSFKLTRGSLGDLFAPPHDSNFTVSQGSPRELGRA